jgi:AcrR family transcriptional regulator
MARPKSENKRNAILAGAIRVFAEKGLGAPTSTISRAAGVAEGTLFIYFRRKDELVNALYREIKLEVADAMMSDFPRKKSVRLRLEHVWNRWVQWGVTNPLEHRVLMRIEVWGGLTEESKAAGSAPFAEIQSMAEHAMTQRIIQDLPQQFVAAALRALAETTMEFMRENPEQAEEYRRYGFELLWAGIVRKR